MKIILLLIIVGLLGALFLPPQLESTHSNCEALTLRVRRMVEIELAKLPANVATAKALSAIAAVRAQLPTGRAIAAVIEARFPQVPPDAGCAVAYWATQIWPDIRSWSPAVIAGRPAG